MPLSASEISDRLWGGLTTIDEATTLCIVPTLDEKELRKKGSASIDLRLGRWFRTMIHTRVEKIKIGENRREGAISKEHYVRFNDEFILHPGQFVIGNTLEWMRLPYDLSAYVTGKSSWGRRGLIIETAAGIHPGFTGCLTLEFANVGSAPIALQPGMPICQVFFHRVARSEAATVTQFVGYRKPALGNIERDDVVDALARQFFRSDLVRQ
jgi:dCTP deaminase